MKPSAKTNYSENKVLTSFPKCEDEVRPAVIATMIFSQKFRWLDVRAAINIALTEGGK